MNLSEICAPHIYIAVILAWESDICGCRCPFLGAHPILYLHAINIMFASQAAKSVRDGRDALFAVFERMETFFRRLETYTEVSPTMAMMDTMTQIMVVTLSIIGITTKGTKQGRMSECCNLVRVCHF